MKKVIVMGYHNIGCRCLKVLVSRGVLVSAVFSHLDDPKEVCWFDSISELAKSYRIPVLYPENPNTPEWLARIRALAPDVIFSCYYRKMLSEELLAIPRYGGINMHGSVLPKYRGRSPVNWQLVHGEIEGGITMHYMVRKADAGDIIGQKKIAIGPDDTALDVFQKVEPAAADLLQEYLDAILDGTAPRIKQDISQGSYFGGRKPDDGKIMWTWPARQVHNLVRAVTVPYPGAFTFLGDKKLMVWRSKCYEEMPAWQDIKPGQVFDHEGKLLIKAATGAIEALQIAWPGQQQSEFVTADVLLKTGDMLS
jgi:methionyl-tRNA formyltransferase